MRGCAPATGINSPQRGGVHGPPARFACAVPAAPRALPGWGLAPPDLQGCAPWRAFAHRAPAASVTQPEGFRARVRRWRGWASRRLVHARRLAPPPLPWIQFFKSKATGAWASRRLVHRRASVPVAAAVGRPRNRPPGRLSTLGGQRGCPRPERATGRSGRGCFSPPERQRWQRHATHRVRRERPQTRASAQASLPTCNFNRATLQQ